MTRIVVQATGSTADLSNCFVRAVTLSLVAASQVAASHHSRVLNWFQDMALLWLTTLKFSRLLRAYGQPVWKPQWIDRDFRLGREIGRTFVGHSGCLLGESRETKAPILSGTGAEGDWRWSAVEGSAAAPRTRRVLMGR